MKRFKIYSGLGGGFGGAQYQETKEFENESEASDYAYTLACEEYDSYSESYGLITTEEALEEAGQNIERSDFKTDEGYDDAIDRYVANIFSEDREEWIDYYVEEDFMKKWLIKVDTNWAGTDKDYVAIAETEYELWPIAEEKAYENFIDVNGMDMILDELFPDQEEYTDEMFEEATTLESEYYDAFIEEFNGTDEQFNQYELIYGEEEN